MKKLIGMLGVAVIAMAMFFNTNAMNGSNGDFDLASLVTLNTANAEGGGVDCDKCVVKKDGNTIFSCKTVQGEDCKSPKQGGATVSCSNAKKC